MSRKKQPKRKHPRYTTLKEYFDYATNRFADRVAFIDLKDKASVTFDEYRNQSVCAAYSLKKLTGNKQVNCAIVAENCYEYMLAYFSIVCSNNAIVMIAGDLDEKTLAYQLAHTDCKLVFVSKHYLAKIEEIKADCPKLKDIVVLDKEINDKYQNIYDLVNGGAINKDKAEKQYQQTTVSKEQLCQILFTSGTSGYNKAVMLSNDNVCCSVYSALCNFGRYDNTISILPFYHAYENSCHTLPAIFCGCCNYINDSLTHLKKNIKETPAEMTVVVPMILDTMANRIKSESKRLHSSKLLQLGLKTSKFLMFFHIDLRELLFKPALAIFSSSLRIFVVGGAAVNPDTYDLLTNMGFTIINGYGETECAPLIACHTPERQKKYSVGRVIENMQVKIGPKDENGNGEILVKGKGVMMGYYNDPVASASTYDEDGWLKTGDLGYINKRGDIYICGRSKNLIILSNGKNIYPEELETLLEKRLNYIEEIIVNTDKKQTGIYANVYLKEEFTKNKTDEEIYKTVKFDIAKFNRKMPTYKYIKDVIISKEPFKKNINRKIVRSAVGGK